MGKPAQAKACGYVLKTILNLIRTGEMSVPPILLTENRKQKTENRL
jgi:hypothetical protein